MSVETYKPKVWQPKSKELTKSYDGTPSMPFFVTGVIPSATGSVYYEDGSTKIICSVYGPKSNPRAQYSDVGVLSCDFSYAPFALDFRRRRGKYDPEEVSISMILKDTLTSSVQLDKFPKHEIQLFVMVLERGNDEVSAAINAASLAIVDSGIAMYDMNVAASCAFLNESKQIVLHPTLEQMESDDCTGVVTISHMPSLQQVTHLYHSGKLPKNTVFDMVQKSVKQSEEVASFLKKQIAANVAKTFTLPEDYHDAVMNAVKFAKNANDFNAQE